MPLQLHILRRRECSVENSIQAQSIQEGGTDPSAFSSFCPADNLALSYLVWRDFLIAVESSWELPWLDDTTTRAPTRLQLQQVEDSKDSLIQVNWKDQPPQKLQKLEDIVQAVEQIMASIPPDAIVKDEVVVQIRDPSVISIEFIDLPGIAAAPKQKKDLTEGLVKQYLNSEVGMFLCVEEAGCSNLDGCQAVGLVLEARMAQRTIMDLTKADTLKAAEVRKRLILRVLRDSGEVTNTDFAGYVAVINRSHHDVKTLIEAGQEEEQTFETQGFSQVPKMPQHMSDLPPAMQRNLCLHNLISQVEALYRDFIVKEWRSMALDRLRPMLTEAKHAVQKLGPDPSTLNVRQLKRFVSLKEEICQRGLQRALDYQLVKEKAMQDLAPLAAMKRLNPQVAYEDHVGLDRLEAAAITYVLQEFSSH
ncbi:hypothetical protein WJX74_006005 [Apatococcus lobatus]|uniref:Dynamin N-terminal domain-containing protein n=1 Tax=Apatococcus lobatus TaxID=904363 RepID=A0AAW1R0I0_9CHLO